jgi:hypothetical protein
MVSVTENDFAALNLMYQAFQDCPRPEHFTDFQHCEECAEHDDTLLSRTPITITRQDVGNPGWDPISFISPAGFRYYLAGLARLVVEEPVAEYDWYAAQFFWHLISDGPDNARFLACSREQRTVVANFIGYIIETRSQQLEDQCIEDDAMRAWEIWSK